MYLKHKYLSRQRLGLGSDCGNGISDSNFLIVFHSNYGSNLLSFRDMTTGRTTYDGRRTGHGNHFISCRWRASNSGWKAAMTRFFVWSYFYLEIGLHVEMSSASSLSARPRMSEERAFEVDWPVNENAALRRCGVRPVFCQCGAPGTCRPAGPASYSPFPFPSLLSPSLSSLDSLSSLPSPLVISLPLLSPLLPPLRSRPLKSSYGSGGSP